MKKSSIFISLMLFLVLSCADTTVKQVSSKGGLKKISDNVYSYAGVKGTPQNSFGANAGIIIGTDGIAVIDTLVSSKESKQLIRDIKAISDKPVKYVINTHYHLDHSFGNAEFLKLGATIISHENCRSNLEKGGQAALQNAEQYGLSKEDMKGTEVAYPSITFEKKLGINLGDRKIEFIFAGSSHTDGSILVYLPEEKILFAGDILFTDFHPFMAEGNIEEWTKVLDYVMAMDVNKIIPGHGPVSGKTDIADMKKYIIAFNKKAKELAAASDDVEYIVSEIIKAVPQKADGQSLVPANIQMKYLKKKE